MGTGQVSSSASTATGFCSQLGINACGSPGIGTNGTAH
jgi:hypothetical protein